MVLLCEYDYHGLANITNARIYVLCHAPLQLIFRAQPKDRLAASAEQKDEQTVKPVHDNFSAAPLQLPVNVNSS